MHFWLEWGRKRNHIRGKLEGGKLHTGNWTRALQRRQLLHTEWFNGFLHVIYNEGNYSRSLNSDRNHRFPSLLIIIASFKAPKYTHCSIWSAFLSPLPSFIFHLPSALRLFVEAGNGDWMWQHDYVSWFSASESGDGCTLGTLPQSFLLLLGNKWMSSEPSSIGHLVMHIESMLTAQKCVR